MLYSSFFLPNVPKFTKLLYLPSTLARIIFIICVALKKKRKKAYYATSSRCIKCCFSGGCDHGCVNTKGSYHCTCKDGFKKVNTNAITLSPVWRSSKFAPLLGYIREILKLSSGNPMSRKSAFGGYIF